MNKIKILSEKVLFNSVYSQKFINYSNELTNIARNHEGFISSKSYFVDNLDPHHKYDTIKIITISQWETNKAWEKWKKSKDRKNVSESFKDLEKREEFKILYDRTINDVFLL